MGPVNSVLQALGLYANHVLRFGSLLTNYCFLSGVERK